MSTEFKDVNYLCLGLIQLEGNVKGIEFVTLDENNQETAKTVCFKKSAYKHCYPGVIYTMASNETKCRKERWFGSWPDTERRLEIVTASKAVEATFTMEAQRKKSEKDKTDILSCLDPIVKAYNKTNRQGQAAILAQAILYIQNGGK